MTPRTTPDIPSHTTGRGAPPSSLVPPAATATPDPAQHSMPSEADDDALAEAIADAWCDESFRNPVLRLHARQAAGLAPEPGRISERQLAAELGASHDTLQRLAARALRKLRPLLRDL